MTLSLWEKLLAVATVTPVQITRGPNWTRLELLDRSVVFAATAADEALEMAYKHLGPIALAVGGDKRSDPGNW